jgi:hypothetical protein
MDQNPYQPPRARIDSRNREPGSIPKAVVTGAVIDIGGTMLGAIVITIIYAMLLGMQGYSAAQIDQVLTQFERWSFFGLLLTGMGMAMSTLGGYQCAIVANRTTYLAPGILSLVSVTFGAVMSDGQAPLQELLIMSAATVAAILGGASFHIRKLVEPLTRPSDQE